MPPIHYPQADIDRIRQDLSDRYLPGFPILKELLQNADDAGVSQLGGEARRVVIVLCQNGLPGAEHRLLRTAGLCVLNDGVFKPEDANSITSFGLSNKADQIGAAGKFGLGLKSIFHWAEAFFYFSECPFENRGAKRQAPHWDLINPWWSDDDRDERRHGEWEQQWKRSRDNDLKAFGNLARRLLGETSRWFGLWVPFRSPEHTRDEAGHEEPIKSEYPSGDLGQLFGENWSDRLTETLPMLRRIELLEIGRLDGNSTRMLATIKVRGHANRMMFCVDNNLLAEEPRHQLAGEIECSSHPSALEFCGFEQLAHSATLDQLKALPHLWPKQARLGRSGAQNLEKAAPHGAVVFTRHSTSARGALRVQPAVFLPLGEPTELELSRGSSWRYNLYLHGFFFVGSGRRDIRYDVLPTGLNPTQVSSEIELVHLWNRTLMREVLAPLVLPSLGAFVERHQMPSADIDALVEALQRWKKDQRKLPILQELSNCMCRGQRFFCRLEEGESRWRLETAGEDGRLWEWIELPSDTGLPEPELFDLLPPLGALCGRMAVSLKGKPFLAAYKEGPRPPNDTELSELLTGVPTCAFNEHRKLAYLLKLIPKEAVEADPKPRLWAALVKLAKLLVSQRLPKDDDLRNLWENFFERLPADRFIRLPFKSTEAAPELVRVLAEADLPILLLWIDFRKEEGKGKLEWAALLPVLRRLGTLELADERVGQRSDIVVRLLQACGDRPPLWADPIADLPLFAAYPPGGIRRAESIAELRDADDERRLFTGGTDWAGYLAKAAPDIRPLFVDPDVRNVLKLHGAECTGTVCVKLLRAASHLAADFASRQKLFECLLRDAQPQASEWWAALRCLLHGDVQHWQQTASLFLLDDVPERRALVRLLQAALKAARQAWRAIHEGVAGQLRLNDEQRGRLNLAPTSEFEIEKLVREIGTSNVDCSDLSVPDCDFILEHFRDVDVLKGLNIHETLQAQRVRVGPHTYVDDREFTDLPVEFNDVVTRLRDRRGYGLFRNCDDSNQLVNKLSWEAVIEIALDQQTPVNSWRTILTAIWHLARRHLKASLRDRIRTVAWLPFSPDTAVKPSQLLDVPDVESELDRLPSDILSGWIPVFRLPVDVDDPQFAAFRRTVLPTAREAVDTLAGLLRRRPDWSTGLPDGWTAESAENWTFALAAATEDSLPVARLVAAIHKQDSLREFLPDLLGQLRNQLSATAYAAILKDLAKAHHEGDAESQPRIKDVFLRYLQAIDSFGAEFAGKVLAHQGVQLLNKSGRWKNADQLAFPGHNIALEYSVSESCADRLASLRRVQTEAEDVPSNEADGETFQAALCESGNRLREYFRPWVDSVPREILGAFLCVLGNAGGIRELAEEMLESGQRTLPETRLAIKELETCQVERCLDQELGRYCFACVIHDQETIRVPSVAGEPFDAPLDAKPSTVFFGSNLRAFRSRGKRSTERWLHLLRFDLAQFKEDPEVLQGLLRTSAEKILDYVFNQTGICLKPLWDRLGQSGQLDIRIAQNRVVEAAPTFLREIGAHRTPQVQQVLGTWCAADRRRADAEERNQDVSGEVKAQLSDAKRHLRELLAEDKATQDGTLSALRHKMIDQYRYDAQSVPLELWQNADDAAVELELLGYDCRPVRELGFVVQCREDTVAFLHWGRLVNEFQTADEGNLRDHGFDQDLEKMVLQSISDKGTSERLNAAVTGKFGLGFKSVLLLSDAPEVMSGNVDFEIRAGVYPVRLNESQRVTLKEALMEVAPNDWRRGTVVRLPLRTTECGKSHQWLDWFRMLAPVLVIFSSRLKRLRLRSPDGQEPDTRWLPSPVVADVECGGAEGIGSGVRRALLLSGTSDRDRLQFLLGLDADGFVPLPDHVPVFWVTAPTRAAPGFGFAVNSRFEPDVGRMQLALQSQENVRLAGELATMLAARLKALLQSCSSDWASVRDQLGLALSTSDYGFWWSLWELLGQRFAKRCQKDDDTVVATLARRILWHSEADGMQGFYGECKALPTGLWGEYRTLTRLGDLRYAAAGVLEREDVFRHVNGWPGFRQRDPEEGEVSVGAICSHRHVFATLKTLSVSVADIEIVRLADAVKWALGQSFRADTDLAARLGRLITPQWLKSLREGTLDEREEQDNLSRLLAGVKFLAEDGSPHKAAELVVATGDGVEAAEEKLRAAFAPPKCRLDAAYTGSALEFFLASRPPRQADVETMTADVETMTDWALQAEMEETQKAALQYLLRGAFKERLAYALRKRRNANIWLWQLEHLPWFRESFSPDEQHEICAYSLRLRDEQLRGPVSPSPPSRPPTSVWNVKDLWKWWDLENRPMGDYTLEGRANWELFHGGAISGEEHRKAELKRLLRSPSESEGKSLWYRFFAYACLLSAGRTVPELRRFWTRQLNAEGFWDRTSNGDFSEQTRRVFEKAVTVEFGNMNASGEQAYFWRRVFYDVRKVHWMVWENDFPAVLLDLVRQQRGNELPQFLRTGHLAGADQPRWQGTFGQSAKAPLSFIIRELVRLEVITDPSVRPFAFFACRPVRRALQKIGWIADDESEFSGEQWEEKLAEDETYGPLLVPCFDIPLLHMGLSYPRDKMPAPPE